MFWNKIFHYLILASVIAIKWTFSLIPALQLPPGLAENPLGEGTAIMAYFRGAIPFVDYVMGHLALVSGLSLTAFFVGISIYMLWKLKSLISILKWW